MGNAILASMSRHAFVVLACILLTFAGCKARPLRASGELSLATSFDTVRDSIRQDSRGFPGLTVNFTNKTGGGSGVPDPAAAPDLMLVEYSGNLHRAHESSVYSDFKGYKARLASTARVYRGVVQYFDPDQSWFLPASAYVWGLFSNTAVLARYGLKPPTDIDSFIAECEALKAKGMAPIALSNSHGWHLLDWLLQIELLRNGPEGYMSLLSGKRSFSDPQTTASLAELDGWISKGYFNPDASSIIWTQALDRVKEGRAAFILIGAFAVNTMTDPGNLSFTLIKRSSKDRVPKAVLGSESGFVFPASGRNLESALAIADTWIIDGAVGLTEDGFRVSAIDARGSQGAGNATQVQVESIRALEGGARIVPLLDAKLTDKAVYDVHQAFISWPPGGFGSKEARDAFAARLAAIVQKQIQ